MRIQSDALCGWLCRKQPPDGDKDLKAGRAYDGVRVLSIKPAQTRKVLRPHGAEREDKYRTATRPAELRVIVAEHGKKPFLKDGVVGELSKETNNSMVWRKEENIRQNSKFRAAKRSFVCHWHCHALSVHMLVQFRCCVTVFRAFWQIDKEIDYGEYTATFVQLQREQARAAKAAVAPQAPVVPAPAPAESSSQ
jgi:hypothetical protein